MDVSRREFLRLSGGAAAFAVVSGLGLLAPRRADAIAGIDDVTLGGVILLIATLGGYALSRTTANTTLGAMGYGFSDFVRDSGHQSEAVTRAIADANNLGIEIERQHAEDAAQAIAEGTGYFGDVMADAADSGRVSLDNFISGADAFPAVFRSLVAGFVGSVMGTEPVALPGITSTGSELNGSLSFPFFVSSVAGIMAHLTALGFDLSAVDSDWPHAIMYLSRNYANGNGSVGKLLFFGDSVSIGMVTSRSWQVQWSNNAIRYYTLMASGGTYKANYSGTTNSWTTVYEASSDYWISGGVVGGSLLPGVDRAIDAPDVITPGYDSLPLGHDLVINPTTDEVVSAGSIALPQSIPEVSGDVVGTYAAILNDSLAGVVPGVVSLPVPVSTPVSVGTATGVATMPISEAISTDTSIEQSGEIVTPPPVSPITPPVSVPDGPWVPAVTLPFEQVWPFNMIYSMVGLFNALGS